MTKCEELALEQSLKELSIITNIVSEVLYMAGYQELQSQFAGKLQNLNLVFKEVKEAKK